MRRQRPRRRWGAGRHGLPVALAACLSAGAAFGFGDTPLDLRGTLDVEEELVLAGVPLTVKTVPIEEAWGAVRAADVSRDLHGRWEGDGLRIQIDAARSQAQMRADRPFQWDRFMVKDVTEGDLAFSVGAELFEAVIDGDEMTVAATSFRGTRRLRRQ
jgi:hypothetical protein